MIAASIRPFAAAAGAPRPVGRRETTLNALVRDLLNRTVHTDRKANAAEMFRLIDDAPGHSRGKPGSAPRDWRAATRGVRWPRLHDRAFHHRDRVFAGVDLRLNAEGHGELAGDANQRELCACAVEAGYAGPPRPPRARVCRRGSGEIVTPVPLHRAAFLGSGSVSHF